MPNFVLFDASYYIFYRYYAIEQWFKLSKPDDPLQTLFVEKFRKTFVDKIGETVKKLKIETPIIMVGKDCHRKDIWRMELFPEYKGTRGKDGFKGGPFFKMAYEDKLFEEGGAKLILYYDTLEADDCIAITVKHLLEKYEDAKIWIIASDMDYLQLACDRVKIYTLKHKDITESKHCFKDSEKDLFCKIVSGDKSDNIPSVFKKCGIKTAEKHWLNREQFQEKLVADPEAAKIYALNKKIIDFNNIPQNLVDGFKKKYGLM